MKNIMIIKVLNVKNSKKMCICAGAYVKNIVCDNKFDFVQYLSCLWTHAVAFSLWDKPNFHGEHIISPPLFFSWSAIYT